MVNDVKNKLNKLKEEENTKKRNKIEQLLQNNEWKEFFSTIHNLVETTELINILPKSTISSRSYHPIAIFGTKEIITKAYIENKKPISQLLEGVIYGIGIVNPYSGGAGTMLDSTHNRGKLVCEISQQKYYLSNSSTYNHLASYYTKDNYIEKDRKVILPFENIKMISNINWKRDKEIKEISDFRNLVLEEFIPYIYKTYSKS